MYWSFWETELFCFQVFKASKVSQFSYYYFFVLFCVRRKTKNMKTHSENTHFGIEKKPSTEHFSIAVQPFWKWPFSLLLSFSRQFLCIFGLKYFFQSINASMLLSVGSWTFFSFHSNKYHRKQKRGAIKETAQSYSNCFTISMIFSLTICCAHTHFNIGKFHRSNKLLIY